MPDFIFTVRNLEANGTFGEDVGDSVNYLVIPEDAKDPLEAHICPTQDWLQQLLTPLDTKEPIKDILIFVHGYNENDINVLSNHRLLKQGLSTAGYSGRLISFDWPCGNNAIMYLDDRHKAKLTAMQLVNSGIALLAKQQDKNCKINVHLLAHSTGALVVREAFSDADDTNLVREEGGPGVPLNAINWVVTQLAFISGDISASCMSLGQRDSISLYAHCIRLTNYQNPYDKILALSNLKRAGFENRVGRIGLPVNIPPKAVNVNAGPYFKTIQDLGTGDTFSHSWYFDNQYNGIFMKDLCYTIQGDIDRNVIPTRTLVNNTLSLNINYPV